MHGAGRDKAENYAIFHTLLVYGKTKDFIRPSGLLFLRYCNTKERQKIFVLISSSMTLVGVHWLI